MFRCNIVPLLLFVGVKETSCVYIYIYRNMYINITVLFVAVKPIIALEVAEEEIKLQ